MYVVERAELWLVCSCFAKWGAGKLRTEAESLTIDSFWTVLIRAPFSSTSRRHLSRVTPGLLLLLLLLPLLLMVMQWRTPKVS
jgi:hypothetical protein